MKAPAATKPMTSHVWPRKPIPGPSVTPLLGLPVGSGPGVLTFRVIFGFGVVGGASLLKVVKLKSFVVLDTVSPEMHPGSFSVSHKFPEKFPKRVESGLDVVEVVVLAAIVVTPTSGLGVVMLEAVVASSSSTGVNIAPSPGNGRRHTCS